MSTPRTPDPARLVISVFMNDKTLMAELLPLLETAFGSVVHHSPWFGFDYTDYYAGEMGAPLFRRMLAFDDLIAQDDLARIKLKTNAMEAEWARAGRRRVNIDPGYLLRSRFVLATGKDFSHRICIGHQIYAEVTLMFKKKGVQVLPWTYPDYASQEMVGFLGQVRTGYIRDLNKDKKRIDPSNNNKKRETP